MSSSDVQTRQVVSAGRRQTDFPLIDNDPHLFRVVRYMRPTDYAYGAAATASVPLAFYAMEKISPSNAPKARMPSFLRLATGIGLGFGFCLAYSLSMHRFQGISENAREVQMDMREMVDKVKKGEPPYGVSTIPEHHQQMAARNSRFSFALLGLLPWFNVVNHPYHGVDTAKYYRQAEKELEEERIAREGS